MFAPPDRVASSMIDSGNLLLSDREGKVIGMRPMGRVTGGTVGLDRPDASGTELRAPAEAPALDPGFGSGARTDERLVGLWLHGKGEATKEAYRGALAAFSGFTGGKPLRAITLADLQEFADDLSEAFAPATQAKVLAAMKSLVSFGHQVGYLPFDVGRPVKLPSRCDDRAERILSADDIHAMIARTKTPRDRALLRSLYIGGLRVAEAVALKSRDLKERERGGQITLFGKGQRPGPCCYPRGRGRSLRPLPSPTPTPPSSARGRRDLAVNLKPSP